MTQPRLTPLIVAAALAVAPVAAAEQRPPVAVAVTATTCEPMALQVVEGETTFIITNRSARTLEWEILDGVMVVDERENIAPGFKARLTTRLKPGTYEITCGLLSNPRGKLVVTADGGTKAKPRAMDLIDAVAEYRVASRPSFDVLGKAAKALAEADRAGDRPAALAAFLAARAAFTALTPLQAMAAPTAKPVADDLAAIEYALFAEPPAVAGEAAARLGRDAAGFAAAAGPIVVPADRLIATTLTLSRQIVAETTATLTPASLSLIADQLAAIDRITRLFAAHTAAGDAAANTAITAAADALRAALGRNSGPIGGYADGRTLPVAQRAALAAAAQTLADRLAPLPGLLGL